METRVYITRLPAHPCNLGFPKNKTAYFEFICVFKIYMVQEKKRKKKKKKLLSSAAGSLQCVPRSRCSRRSRGRLERISHTCFVQGVPCTCAFYTSRRSTASFKLLICDFSCDPSFVVTAAAITALETPHARPNACPEEREKTLRTICYSYLCTHFVAHLHSISIESRVRYLLRWYKYIGNILVLG